MPAQIAEYKCPACTGPLHFVGESGKLECDYCGSTYDVAEIEALYAGQEAGAKAAFQEAEAKEKTVSREKNRRGIPPISKEIGVRTVRE